MKTPINGKLYDMNVRSKLFYAHDLMSSSGKKFIVSQMCGQQSSTQVDIYNKMSAEEVDYQIMLSRFVCNLTRSQQKDFGQLMGLMKNIYLRNNDNDNSVGKFPESYADIRRMYLDGDVAITKQIPIPEVKMNNDHSIVSLMDCVADFVIRTNELIHDVEEWDNVTRNNCVISNNDLHLFRSNRIKSIIKKAKNRIIIDNVRNSSTPMLVLFITVWSDDFDPNKSIKNNRQSVWIKTITIFTMSKFGEKKKITYPVCLAFKGSNHDSVDLQHSLELSSLTSGELLSMYSKSHNAFVHIHADIFSILNDQPERRGNLGLANGNSMIHGRFGLLLDSRQVVNAIRSCPMCSKSIIMEALNEEPLLKYEWRENTCIDCSSWMYHIDHQLLYYTPEKDFPQEICPSWCAEGKLPPRKITRSGIDMGIYHVKDMIHKKRINLTQAKSYLKYLGLNDTAREAVANGIKTGKHYSIPNAWYDFDDTTVFVDVPMHLLFLCIVKNVMLKIGAWLRLNHCGNPFVESVKGILNKIKELNVEWCKILEYPTTDKTGGWVSENFLAMSRLANWFYTMLHFVSIQDEYNDPVTHYTTWDRSQCEKWLQVRGLDKKGKISELSNTIKGYIESNTIPSINIKNYVSVEDITNMINSMCLMIQMIMCHDTSTKDISRIEALIRMFLIHYDKVDSGMIERTVPQWIKQYNMLCLLNIPKSMIKFGHIRNLWEGGRDGESYLKTVKSHMSAGLVHGWQNWVLTNLLKEEIYDDWKPTKDIEQDIRKEVKVYGKYELAKEAFLSGNPFSAIMVKHRIYICFRYKGSIKANCIELSNKKEGKYNQLYYSIQLTTKSIIINQTKHTYVGVIFLPKLVKEGYAPLTNDLKYCYIRSDWI